MKSLKLTLLGLLTASVFLLVPAGVSAEEVLSGPCSDPQIAAQSTLCKENANNQDADCNSVFGRCGIVTKAARLVLIVVGVASVIMIIIGSIQYVISSGDPTNINNAKNTILYAIIGLVIALTAQGIILFVLNRL